MNRNEAPHISPGSTSTAQSAADDSDPDEADNRAMVRQSPPLLSGRTGTSPCGTPSGLDACVSKPINPATLFDAIERVLTAQLSPTLV